MRAVCDDCSALLAASTVPPALSECLAGVVVLLGASGFAALGWRSAIAPIIPSSRAGFPVELVNQGEALASAGYCAECHTAKGGPAFAGGYAMSTPFGVLYSTNITPDPEDGHRHMVGSGVRARNARRALRATARISFPRSPTIIYEAVR